MTVNRYQGPVSGPCVALGAVAAAIVLAACSGEQVGSADGTSSIEPTSSEGSTASGTDAAPDLSADIGSLILPFGPFYQESQDDRLLLSEAVDRLANQCMADRGFPYPRLPPDVYEPSMNALFRYGGFTAGQPAEFGYRSPLSQQYVEHDREAVSVEQSMPADPAFFEALSGTYDAGGDAEANAETLGCVDSAQISIFGAAGGFVGLAGYEQILQLQIDSFKSTLTSESGQLALNEWSTCMELNGYIVAGLFEPANQWPWDVTVTAPPSDAEVVMAMTDAECRRTHSLELRLYNIESELQNRMIEENIGTFESYRDEVDAAVERAVETIGNEP